MPSNIAFINRDKVVMKFIKYRCRLADFQSKANQKTEFLSKDSILKRKRIRHNELYDMFPSRKHWCNIGESNRNLLDTAARNERRLKLTYLKAKKNNCQDTWYLLLCKKADEVVKVAIGNKGMNQLRGSMLLRKNERPNKSRLFIVRFVLSH